MPNSVTIDELETLIRFRSDVQIIDVRKRPAYDDDSAVVAGAVWRDPFEVAAWAGGLDKSRPVICYCVHGHQVSQSAASQLAETGFDAYYMRGGMDAWKDAAAALDAKPAEAT